MLRNNNPRRAGLKAMQAIKENSQNPRNKVRTKSENPQQQQAGGGGGKKRSSSPTASMLALAPKPKRNALGDVTNNKQKQEQQQKQHKNQQKPQPKQQQPQGPQKVAVVKPKICSPGSQMIILDPAHQPHPHSRIPSVASSDGDNEEASQVSSLGSASQDTPVTAMQNVLQATTLDDSGPTINSELPIAEVEPTPAWTNIDQAEAQDPSYSSEYAPEIYQYMMQRERQFEVQPYMHNQKDITPVMRTILVDWLIEVQENFELFHETLYLSVKLVDIYLSRKEVLREFLQLVGATCLLIASKFEELSPPLVDDFLYLCDDAYTRDQMLTMEREVLLILGYDINIPVAYRFIRRLARAASATMETHTMARYIAEHSLQEYQFIDVRPSLLAAASMYLALRMKKLGGWTPTLQHYSGYPVNSLLPVAERLNQMLKTPLSNQKTVRSKYSHEVFFKVAQTPPLADVQEDARDIALS